jgi:hypothetical protein
LGLTAKQLYEHPRNATLRSLRSNPNILYPGDEVFLPDPAAKQESCPTGNTYIFKLHMPKAEIRIILQDRAGTPFANKKFVVAGKGVRVEGTTDAKGLLKAEVPATLETATLTAWIYGDDQNPDDPASPDIEYDLNIGHLDPHDTPSGVQSRLRNLGYTCETTGESNEETARAMERFRNDQGLADCDEIHDPALCERLKALQEDVA